MDFSNFLGKLDESKDKGFVRVSGKQLREAAGETVEALKSSAQWYYVPQKEYGGFRHIVVENGPNDWAVYYLKTSAPEQQVPQLTFLVLLVVWVHLLVLKEPVLAQMKLAIFKDFQTIS